MSLVEWRMSAEQLRHSLATQAPTSIVLEGFSCFSSEIHDVSAEALEGICFAEEVDNEIEDTFDGEAVVNAEETIETRCAPVQSRHMRIKSKPLVHCHKRLTGDIEPAEGREEVPLSFNIRFLSKSKALKVH